MYHPATTARLVIPTFRRLVLLTVMLFSPIVAVSFAGEQGLLIEAPVSKKMGAGLVILMSLQRN